MSLNTVSGHFLIEGRIRSILKEKDQPTKYIIEAGRKCTKETVKTKRSVVLSNLRESLFFEGQKFGKESFIKMLVGREREEAESLPTNIQIQ